ncbi:MAG: hypothetical protein ACXVA2_16285 [Mucilaginibacter sp.]
MKQIVSLIFILWIFSSCTPNGAFPDKITTIKTTNSVRIKGTKVYIQPQDGFEYFKQSATYRKKGSAYLQVLEANTYGFSKIKHGLTRQSLEAKGAKVDVIKDIKFNQFDAVYAEGPADALADQTIVSLFFGDDNFAVIIKGVYKTGDDESKKELREMLKTIYYDSSLQIDPFELANFEFDPSITNFKYAMTASNFYKYAENGKKDAENETADSFEIGALGKMTDEMAYNDMNNWISKYVASHVDFENKTITRSIINGYHACVLESKITNQYRDGVIYAVYIEMNDKTMVFIGSAYNDTGNYLEKFKKTVQTIKDK